MDEQSVHPLKPKEAKEAKERKAKAAASKTNAGAVSRCRCPCCNFVASARPGAGAGAEGFEPVAGEGDHPEVPVPLAINP